MDAAAVVVETSSTPPAVSPQSPATPPAPFRPILDRLLVRVKEPEAQIGRIIVPERAKTVERIHPTEGVVVALGDGLPIKGGREFAPWPFAVGDRVLFAKNMGGEVEVNGETLRWLPAAAVVAVLESDLPVVNVGRVAFEAYNGHRGGKTHDGRTTPQWDELGPEIRRAWDYAADCVYYVRGVPSFIVESVRRMTAAPIPAAPAATPSPLTSQPHDGTGAPVAA